VVVYVSWNGATGVRRWRVLAGTPPRAVADAAKDGFETAIPVRSDATRFRVEALDAKGRVLRSSNDVASG
jgi:hypothetical protein